MTVPFDFHYTKVCIAVGTFFLALGTMPAQTPASSDVGDWLPTTRERMSVISELNLKKKALTAAVINGQTSQAQFRQDIERLVEALRTSAASELAAAESKTEDEAGSGRLYALPGLAKWPLAAGNDDKAKAYVDEMRAALADPATNSYSFRNNLIHDSNMVDGFLALRRGDVSAAKSFLLKAGRNDGSPTLNSFGPNMSLARELAERGERETVILYLTECERFWKGQPDRVGSWIRALGDGATPDFLPNLGY